MFHTRFEKEGVMNTKTGMDYRKMVCGGGVGSGCGGWRGTISAPGIFFCPFPNRACFGPCFGFCNVPCREGLWSSAFYFGDFPRWG